MPDSSPPPTILSEESRSSTSQQYAVAIALALIAGLWFAERRDRLRFPVGPDGVSYIQSAKNSLLGRGLTHSPQGLSPACFLETAQSLDSDLVPLQLWPPGLPLMIAAVSALGVDPFVAAIWTARVCWLLLPAGFVFCLRPLGGGWIAVALGLLVMFAPGAIPAATLVSSEAPFLLLTLMSLGVLFREFERNGHMALILASGLFAGAAYSVRNVGLALLVTVPATSATVCLCRLHRLRPTARTVMLWVLGALPIVVAVKLRSWLVFGTLEPYNMPRNESGFAEIFGHNARLLLGMLIGDVTGNWTLASSVAWNKWLLLACVPAALVGLGYLLLRWGRGQPEAEKRRRWAMAMLLATYFCAGLALFLTAVTIYVLEGLQPRYVWQYSWILTAAILVPLASPVWRRKTSAKIVLAALLVAMLCGRAYHVRDYLASEPDPRVAVAGTRHARETLDRLPVSALIVSNNGPFFTIMSGRSVRHVVHSGAGSDRGENPYERELSRIAREMDGARPLFAAFLCQRGGGQAVGGLLIDSTTGWVPDGFRVVTRDDNFLLLEFDPSVSVDADGLPSRRLPETRLPETTETGLHTSH